MQNMQSGGVQGLELGTALGYIMCKGHKGPLVRKFYSTVSESTTIPGRKIRLLMFVCHSRSVCTVCMKALMTYPVCANRMRTERSLFARVIVYEQIR